LLLLNFAHSDGNSKLTRDIGTGQPRYKALMGHMGMDGLKNKVIVVKILKY